MAFITPFASEATEAEAAAVTVCPAATRAADRTVQPIKVTGRAADAKFSVNTAATPPLASARPRRVSRFANIDRAVARRLLSVPKGNPRRRAASLRETPSKSQSKTGPRYFS
jgi:hypothetical protein